MHDLEGHQTRSEHETGLFWKLSGAFVSNNVLMPVAVACLQSLLSQGTFVSQAFYEKTGLMTFAVVLITIQRITSDLPRAVQALSLCKRYLRVCAPASKLHQLWQPPEMRISLQLAQLYWLFSCALMYGPLSPLFYLLAAIYALWTFVCTKFGVVFWYRRPAAIANLGRTFRRLLLLLLPLHLTIKLFVRLAAEPSAYRPYSWAFFGGGLGLCLLAGFLLGGSAALEAEDAYQRMSERELDTDGIRYDEVEASKGYPIDAYVNPLVRGQMRSRRGYFGDETTALNRLDATNEALDQNTAAFSASFPLDELPMPPIDALIPV